MRVSRRAPLLAALAVLTLATTASAQMRSTHVTGFAQGNRPTLGAQVGYGSNHTKFFIGGQFAYPIMNRLDIYPTFQYYFPGNSIHLWSLAGNVRYWPKLNIKDSGLYFGGGVDISHTSVTNFGSSTDAGLSLLSGWQFKTSSTNLLPFGQIRVVIGDADRIEFGAGVNFKL
jgi:hypothetical protein